MSYLEKRLASLGINHPFSAYERYIQRVPAHMAPERGALLLSLQRGAITQEVYENDTVSVGGGRLYPNSFSIIQGERKPLNVGSLRWLRITSAETINGQSYVVASLLFGKIYVNTSELSFFDLSTPTPINEHEWRTQEDRRSEHLKTEVR